jgi:hypothetical protein
MVSAPVALIPARGGFEFGEGGLVGPFKQTPTASFWRIRFPLVPSRTLKYSNHLSDEEKEAAKFEQSIRV